MRAELVRSDRGDRRFRWRGRDVSRIENLSDIVFALALGLAAAAATPQSVAELAGMWRNALAVAACFALLLLIWRMHYVFFRRYDLEDARTVVLNSILLFLIMAFAYPLKFLATFLIDLATYAVAGQVAAISMLPLSFSEARLLTVIYSSGYAGVFGVFALMYAHALARADAIGLTPCERAITRMDVGVSAIHVAIASAVAVGALALPARHAVWTGMLFFAVGPAITVYTTAATRRIDRLAAQEASSESA